MTTDLITIPGIGKELKEHLIMLGYTSVESLIDANAEELYEKDKKMHNDYLDRCVLYVYRCAIEYAKTKNKHLKWWDFKD